MNKDFWERIDRLEELAVLFADDKVSYGTYIGTANPAMILEMIAEMRMMEREVVWLLKNTDITDYCAKHEDEYCLWNDDFEFLPLHICPIVPEWVCQNCWREAVRKAVSEADNA